VGATVVFNDVIAKLEKIPLQGVVTQGPSEHGYCDVRHASGSVIRHVDLLIFKDELN
jgi:hypothetical protein